MRIKSMMKGMLAVVMAMSMAACSGAPAADQTSSESPSPAQTESTAATEQETIVTEVSAETQTQEETASTEICFLFIGDGMSYPQFQAASDYLGAIADEDYVKALPSNSYEDRGGAVLDGPEAGYKVTYTQADAEAVTAEDGRVILMDEHLADSDAMDYDMDRADGEWALSDYVQKGIEVLDNDTGFFMMCEGGKIDWACFQPSPGRFPSSAGGSGFTHLLLMYMNLD